MRIDLSTNYLGMRLENPIVPSASPLTSSLEGLKRLADAGAGAIVLGSLFQEQLDPPARRAAYEEALGYYPTMRDYRIAAEEYLALVETARRELPVPVIASLNGRAGGDWVKYAARLERAGASALELNVYHLTADPAETSAQIEETVLDLVEAVRGEIRIPLAVKLSSQLTAPANFVRRLKAAQVDGVVLFNRFFQADLDIEAMEVKPHLELSRSHDLLMPLTWTGMLFGRVDLDIAVSGGVHTSQDVLKALVAGATVTQVASELLQQGAGRLAELLSELEDWLKQRDYASVEQLRGRLSQARLDDQDGHLRADNVRTLQLG